MGFLIPSTVAISIITNRMKSESVEENINHAFAFIKYNARENRLDAWGWFSNICEAGGWGSVGEEGDSLDCLSPSDQLLFLKSSKRPKLRKGDEAES